MKLTKKDWLGMFAMTADEKRMVAILVALAVLGLVGRYFYLYGRTVKSQQPAGIPETFKAPARAPVAE